MKIEGHWNKSAGWPAIHAKIECSFPYVRGHVELALDTGSPITILSQPDAAKLNIKYDKLRKAQKSWSIAGYSGIPYNWDFGDGSTAQGIVVVHTFENPGDYTVTLAWC